MVHDRDTVQSCSLLSLCPDAPITPGLGIKADNRPAGDILCFYRRSKDNETESAGDKSRMLATTEHMQTTLVAEKFTTVGVLFFGFNTDSSSTVRSRGPARDGGSIHTNNMAVQDMSSCEQQLRAIVVPHTATTKATTRMQDLKFPRNGCERRKRDTRALQIPFLTLFVSNNLCSQFQYRKRRPLLASSIQTCEYNTAYDIMCILFTSDLTKRAAGVDPWWDRKVELRMRPVSCFNDGSERLKEKTLFIMHLMRAPGLALPLN
ncbi:hypothetical protein CBL_10401 [Carabus blaptoides fortunei]